MISISEFLMLFFFAFWLNFLCSFFFESVTWDETGVGFEKVPGGSDYANRSVLSYHFYIPPMVLSTLAIFQRIITRIILVTQITHAEFSEREKDVKRLNCASKCSLLLQPFSHSHKQCMCQVF